LNHGQPSADACNDRVLGSGDSAPIPMECPATAARMSRFCILLRPRHGDASSLQAGLVAHKPKRVNRFGITRPSQRRDRRGRRGRSNLSWKTRALPVLPAAAPFLSFNGAPASLSLRACLICVARASRGRVNPRHHKQRGENCVEQHARAVGTPGHNTLLSRRMHHVIRDIGAKRRVVCDLHHTLRFGVRS